MCELFVIDVLKVAAESTGAADGLLAEGSYITGSLLPSCDRTGCCNEASAGAVRSLNMVSVRPAVGVRAVQSAGLNAFSQ